MSQTLVQETSASAGVSIISFNEALRGGSSEQWAQSETASTQSPDSPAPLSRTRSVIIFITVTMSYFISSFTTGLLTTGLSVIAKDLALPEHLLLWPSSVFALTCGSLLLLAGSVGDILGNRTVFLTGVFFISCSTLACGLARSGIQLILFRAMQGVAASLCMTNLVSIVTKYAPSGRVRNIAFSCLGLSQPSGFSIGLILGGIFADTVGWRTGWYISSAAFMVLFLVGIWAIPTQVVVSNRPLLYKLRTEVDWVGTGIACSCLALFAFVLAQITSNIGSIRQPANMVPLCISIVLAPTFVFWMNHQEQCQKPALIPNSMWKRKAFGSTCFMILAASAVTESMEYLVSLYFQNVQGVSALQSSLRLLPSCVVGGLVNLSTGFFIHKAPARYLVIISSLLNGGCPLLMALVDPRWPYWYAEFPSQALQSVSYDVLFTVGLLVISDVFPENQQALAGGVFNMVTQLGIAIGLAIMGVVSRSATEHTGFQNKNSPAALQVGYKASFWTALALNLLASVIGGIGLRKIGKVGLKRD